MKNRTLLLLTYHFPPSAASGSFRLLGFARHLSAHGWRTVVVAPPGMPGEPVDDKLTSKVPADTVTCYVPYPGGNKLVRRFAPYGAWTPAAFQACSRAIAEHRPDAVLTSSPPHTIHLLGRLLKSRFGLPWIVDYRDPWLFGTGEPTAGTWGACFERFKEWSVLKAADAIVVNTPLAQAALESDAPEFARKMITITNGFDPEEFACGAGCQPASDRQVGDLPHITLLHTGELYSGRDPRCLFDALVGLGLPNAEPLRVTFLGQASDTRYDWPGEVARRGLTGVVDFAGHVRYDQALQQMSRADVLLLLDRPGRRVGIPAKLYEYFGTRRPILALTDPQGDVGWALRQSGVRHRIAQPNDVAGIRRALVELLQECVAGCQPATLRQVSDLPHAVEFTRAHTAGQLAAVLDAKTARRRKVVAS